VSIAEEVRGLLAGLPARAMLHLVTNCEGCEFELLEVLFFVTPESLLSNA
jgi:hypothetical protein